MRISLVVAAARNGTIGLRGEIPWKLPDDQRFFRKLTLGHPIVMGRKTWDSLGKPLPKRIHLVLSRKLSPEDGTIPEGVHVFSSLDAAEAWARDQAFEELFVIGGEAVYREAMDHADLIYRTLVEAEPEGDAFFPEIDRDQFLCVQREMHPADAEHAHAFRFETWQRRDA